MVILRETGIAVVVPAAGRGTRMGHAPKLLLPMGDGRPVVYHAVLGALALEPLEVVVVTRPDLPEMAQVLAGLPVTQVPNPRYAEGMGTSLAAGIGGLSEGVEAALVMLGDEPAVSPEIVEALVAAYVRERTAITVPVYGKQVGPPTLFSRALFEELRALEGDVGGRQLMERHPEAVCRVPLPTEWRPRDIDTPEDYQSLLAP
jgi:molybdenum cofactor cytidylyltransferase